MFHACEKLSICIPVAHQAGAYPSFLSMKRLGVFLLSLGGILVHLKGVLSAMNLPGLFRNTWVKRGTMAVKGIAQEHNTCPRPGLQTGPLDLKTSTLTKHMRPLHAPPHQSDTQTRKKKPAFPILSLGFIQNNSQRFPGTQCNF